MAETPLWMPLYVSDYMGDTARLTCEQHGAYLQLIMDYWLNGPPPDDDEVLMQIVKLDRQRWKKNRPMLVRLFQVENGEWRHKRIELELAKGRQVIEQKRLAGRKSAEARWGNTRSTPVTTDAITDAQREDQRRGNQPQPQPQPQSQEEEEVGEIIPLPRRVFAFSGRTIQLNQRDFEEWRKRYSAIPDLAAELGALDDWLRTAPQAKRDNWFMVVSGALARKHQQAVAEAERAESDDCGFNGPC